MNMINTIFWDFAGVVLHTVKGTFNSLLAERLDVPLGEVEKVISSPMNDKWDIDEIDDKTFYTYLLQETGQPLEKMPILERFVVKDFYVDPEMLAYIKSLRDQYQMVLLTNFPCHIHTFFKTDWIIDGAFDDVIVSCDVKLIKPDPAIYTLALERAGCQPEQAVFIDDRIVNVAAAQELGINGILFESREQTCNDLEKLLAA
jgi:epoxide hydrolase-like predicted phosphatase